MLEKKLLILHLLSLSFLLPANCDGWKNSEVMYKGQPCQHGLLTSRLILEKIISFHHIKATLFWGLLITSFPEGFAML